MIVETGSILNACDLLGINPKTLKKRIQLLESYLNIPLADFEKQEINISTEGMRLYASINDPLDRLDRTLSLFGDKVPIKPKQIINILVPPGSALMTYQHILPELEKKIPNIEVTIHSHTYEFLAHHGDYLQKFLENYDIISIDERLLSLISKQDWTVISRFTDVRHLYAHQDYLKDNPITDLTSLSKARFITTPNTLSNDKLMLRSIDNNQLEAVGFNSITTFENGLSVMLLAAKSLGVGAISEVIAKSLTQGSLQRVLPEWQIEYNPIYESMYRTDKTSPEILQQILMVAEPYYSQLTQA